MAETLKSFEEGEDILASETNSNNQYLLSKLSDNAAQVQNYLEGQISSIKSNVATVQATLQGNIDKVNETLNNLTDNLLKNISPNYSAGKSVTFPTSANKYTAPNYGIYVTTIFKNQGNTRLYINGVASAFWHKDNADGASYGEFTVPLSKGDVIYWNASADEVLSSVFYPYKGV